MLDTLSTLVLAGRLLLSLVFGVSSISKLKDLPSTYTTVSDYHLLPDNVVKPGAILLILAEGAASMGLLSNAFVRPSSIMAGGILLTVTVAIVVNLRAGRYIRCGCFGSEEVIGVPSLVRNGLLLIVTIAVSLGYTQLIPGREQISIAALMALSCLSGFIVLRQAIKVLVPLASKPANGG